MLVAVSRPLRVEQRGVAWHVTSHGARNQQVYQDDFDRHGWVRLLESVATGFGWRVHAYLLMRIHYHLVVETSISSLSRGMRQLNGVYTQSFNRKHRRVGPLFRGRFDAVPVRSDFGLLELLRGVMLKPVRGLLVDTPSDWPWSSYRATAGEVSAPPWLDTSWTLSQFGGSPQSYRDFVCEGHVYVGPETSPAPTLPAQQFSADDVLRAALDALELSQASLTLHRRRWIRERTIVAHVLRRFAGLTGAEVATILDVSAWHASKLARAGEERWNRDAELASRVQRALHRLREPSHTAEL
jgi:hypothetical protein